MSISFWNNLFFSIHTDLLQLYVLIQIPPTVDKYYDNLKMCPNLNNCLCTIHDLTAVLSP